MKLDRDLREKIEFAIEEEGNKVSAGEAAAKAGVSIFEAEKALNALANDTQADL